ncbi:MAG: acetate kinase, partial [Cyanobacteria bacterium P01_A01_bin.137]
MKILVLNAGSSSHKLCLYALGHTLPAAAPSPVWEAQIDWYPDQAVMEIKTDSGVSLEQKVDLTSRRDTLSQVLSTLWQGTTQVLKSPHEIDAVGHRVVHGGQTYQASTVVTPEVKAEIDRLKQLAPNHNPANLEGIELMEELMGEVPQVAVFDTAFHSQMVVRQAIQRAQRAGVKGIKIQVGGRLNGAEIAR